MAAGLFLSLSLKVCFDSQTRVLNTNRGIDQFLFIFALVFRTQLVTCYPRPPHAV